MSSSRLETFTDGVIAILITIMVLDLRVPPGSSWAAIGPSLPILVAYALSFVFLGIYWNNHHHMLSAISNVSGGALWANLNLLFWLSLVPFVTHWMDLNGFASTPTAAYGIILLMCAIAYFILVRVLVHVEGKDSAFAQTIGRDSKGYVSLVLYVAAIPIAFALPIAALTIYGIVALMWLVPDRRFEQHRHH